MKTVEELLAEVMNLQSPDRNWFDGDVLGHERWNAAVSQYDLMMPLIQELCVSLEGLSLRLTEAIALAREAVNLNDRYDTLLQMVMAQVRGDVAL